MNHLGYEWVLQEDRHDRMRVAEVHGRFKALTWEFGEHRHQAKVLVDYPHGWRPRFGDHAHVDVGLTISTKIEVAMGRCIKWIEKYLAEGPETPDQEMAKCFREYPGLFKRRHDVLTFWWFECGGDGYDWLDGAIFSTDKEPPIRLAIEDNVEKLYEIEKQIWELLPADAKDENPGLRPPEPEPTTRPLPDDGRLLNINLREPRLLSLPPDLRPEWRLSAIEAATLLQDRAMDPEARLVGARVLEQLQP